LPTGYYLSAQYFRRGAATSENPPDRIPKCFVRCGLSARTEALRQGLRELGYAEGKDIIVEWRYAEGRLDRQRELAAELVRLKVEVIVSAGPEPTRAAKAATLRFPLS